MSENECRKLHPKQESGEIPKEIIGIPVVVTDDLPDGIAYFKVLRPQAFAVIKLDEEVDDEREPS